MLTYKQSDITTATEDIVVNAANGIGWMGGFLTRLYKFNGISEAINYVTQGKVEKEVNKLRKIYLPGDAFFTAGYGIGKIGIVHAVTMLILGWWTTEKTVRMLLPKIVKLAQEHGAKSIALPYLGCGTGRLKQEKVEKIYQEFFAENALNMDVIIYYL